MADRPVNGQLLIAYGRGPRATVIYTTAYTFKAAQAALRRCIAQHGEWACARVVTDDPSQASALCPGGVLTMSCRGESGPAASRPSSSRRRVSIDVRDALDWHQRGRRAWTAGIPRRVSMPMREIEVMSGNWAVAADLHHATERRRGPARARAPRRAEPVVACGRPPP